jgi:hypothetical protein
MTTSEATSRLSGMLLLSGVLVVPAFAGTVTVACDPDPAYKSPAMTLVYEGEAEGTLSIRRPSAGARLERWATTRREKGTRTTRWFRGEARLTGPRMACSRSGDGNYD